MKTSKRDPTDDAKGRDATAERGGDLRPVTTIARGAASAAARQALLTELMFGVDVMNAPTRTVTAPVDESAFRTLEGAGAAPSAAAESDRLPSQPTQAVPPPTAPRSMPRSATPIVSAGLSREARGELLEALRAEHASACPHCTASRTHTHVVFGEGDPAARLMFIGEAPGETEDRVGRPFVGRAGEKLDEIIRAMRLRREDVYIANVLKTRPPDNRTPLQHEVDACGPYLKRQIAIVRPAVIVTLGGPATKLVLAVEQGITRLRGVWARYRDDSAEEVVEIPVMPTFHPAYLLRNYTVQTRTQVWDDMKQVLERMAELAPEG